MINMKGDSFAVNHFVAKTAKDYMLPTDEVISIQFQKLVTLQDGSNKYARCSFNGSHKVMMEIIEKYGLNPQGRWKVWDSTFKKNIQYSGSIE